MVYLSLYIKKNARILINSFKMHTLMRIYYESTRQKYYFSRAVVICANTNCYEKVLCINERTVGTR